MSREAFDDECPGCRPALVDPRTGEKYADSSPPMVALNAVWAATPVETRRAFHRVTCLDSLAFMDIEAASNLMVSFKHALNHQ